MQEAPHSIESNTEDETMALPEEELSAEAEIETKEELPREAMIKAEEEEVAASMREIAHRAKEEVLEKGEAQEDLEEAVQPASTDARVDLEFSQEEPEVGEEDEEKKETASPLRSKTSLPPDNVKKIISEKRAHQADSKKDFAPPPHFAGPLSPSPSVSALQHATKPLPPVSANALEVFLTFVLGRQSISMEQLQFLAEEKIIPLGGSDFQVKIELQDKTIAEAQLVIVEGVPSVQITKICT